MKIKDKTYWIILMYILCFLGAMIVFKSEPKQSIINENIVFNIEDFFSIIFRNTIVTLWIFSAIFVGKIMLHVFAAINGICLGLLMSKFSTMKYLLLVLPHGIIEMGSFFLMCDTILNIIKKANIGKGDVSKIMIAYILLIVAAIIETFFTPVIWDIFSSYIYFSGLPHMSFIV